MVSGQAAGTPWMDERAAQLGVRASAFLVEPDAAGLETLAELVRAGRLIVHIDRELPLAEAATAQRIVAKGQTSGKVVLRVAQEESLVSRVRC